MLMRYRVYLQEYSSEDEIPERDFYDDIVHVLQIQKRRK